MKPDIKGLTKLAREMRKVPKREFDMEHWWMKNECGSVGCILGWASQLFPARFKRVQEYRDTEDGQHMYRVECRRTGNHDEDAFADGFRIDYDDACNLVMNFDITTPKQAAQEIMFLVGRLKKQVA